MNIMISYISKAPFVFVFFYQKRNKTIEIIELVNFHIFSIYSLVLMYTSRYIYSIKQLILFYYRQPHNVKNTVFIRDEI